MPSTYTTNTGIEKPATGEQSGTWGGTVNTNFDILDRALNGVGSIELSGTTHTLTTTDGTLSDGMYRVLVFGGSPSGTNTVTIAPNDAQKLYFVRNDSGESVVLSQGTGSNVTVANGDSAIVYADGAGSGAAVSEIYAPPTLADLGITATAAELNYNDITTLGTSEASKVVTADADGVVKFAASAQGKSNSLTGTTPSVDCKLGDVFTLTTSGNTTFTFSNAPSSGVSYVFILKITAGGSHTLTWPASVDWPAGSTPGAPASGETDVYVFLTFDGGTTWYGFLAGGDLS